MKELQYHRNINSLMRNRHRHIIKRHFTTRKVWNLMKSYLNFRLKKRHVSSFPTYLKIETTDRCQLRCPGCHDGSVPRKNLFLDFDLYTHLIDQLGPYLLEVSLFDQGEPLLDRRITEFVEYASSRNIGTVISTNLSLPLSDETMIRLIDGGLDYLQVAIDALDQDSYQEYRVGGKLDLVFRNLERLVSLKKERGSSTPFIEWQMIEFPFNANQRQAAEKKAMAMGVESFVLKPDGRCNQSGQEYARGGFCPLLWFSLAVECDGHVSACLINDDDSLMVGDLHTNDVVEIWNSEAYRHLRASVPRTPENGRSFCQNCNWFDQGNPA